MFTARPELMDRIVDHATGEIMRRALGVAESLTGVSGEVWGDERQRGGRFLAYYADLDQRGVLDALRVVSPELAVRMDRQYEREVGGLLRLG